MDDNQQRSDQPTDDQQPTAITDTDQVGLPPITPPEPDQPMAPVEPPQDPGMQPQPPVPGPIAPEPAVEPAPVPEEQPVPEQPEQVKQTTEPSGFAATAQPPQTDEQNESSE